MAAPAHRIHHSCDTYLALERGSNVKHEYLDGQIYAMAGGTPLHAALAMAIGGLLVPQLLGTRCRAYSSDLRVLIEATGLITYPDATVVCGPPEHRPKDKEAVVNPVVIFEVMSPSSSEYDRGDKWEHYQGIPSLRHYVLVAQDERRVEVFMRANDGSWSSTVSGDGAMVALPAIEATLDVRRLYDASALPA